MIPDLQALGIDICQKFERMSKVASTSLEAQLAEFANDLAVEVFAPYGKNFYVS